MAVFNKNVEIVKELLTNDKIDLNRVYILNYEYFFHEIQTKFLFFKYSFILIISITFDTIFYKSNSKTIKFNYIFLIKYFNGIHNYLFSICF